MNTTNVIPIIKNELRQLMDQRNLTIAQLAQLANVSVATIHKLIQKETEVNITLQVLEKISRALNIPVEFLFSNSKTNLTTSKVNLIDWDNILDRNSLDTNNLKKINTHSDLSAEAFSVKMSDNSMQPLFSLGTILIIDPKADIYDGCFALINVENKAVFKQIIIDPPDVFYTSLRSGNKNMKPIKDDIIIGTLVESITLHENVT